MDPWGEVLDRGVPDEVDTVELPTVPAAELDHLAGRTERWVTSRGDVSSGVAARALVVAGRPADARAALDVAVSVAGTPQAVAAAVWAASRVGEPDHLDALSRQVDSLSRPFVFEGDLPLGATAVLDGLLAAARADLVAAASHLRRGVDDGDRRAPLWGALARLELARVLASERDDRSDRGEDASAVEAELTGALAAVRLCCVAAGYRHLHDRADEVDRRDRGSTCHLCGEVAAPSHGVLVPGPEWRVGFGVQPSVALPSSIGLALLHHLVVHRGRRVSVVELDAVASGEDPQPLLAADLVPDPDGPDGLGVAAMRDRLLDDRARSRVSKLIRRTIARISEVHPLAGRHLAANITTGWACSYDAPAHVGWTCAGAEPVSDPAQRGQVPDRGARDQGARSAP